MSDLHTDYKAAIAQAIRDVEYSLGQGGAKDFAEYQRKVGIIQGLKAALNHYVDVVDRYYHEEDLN